MESKTKAHQVEKFPQHHFRLAMFLFNAAHMSRPGGWLQLISH
jgi:hypothetical protein